VCLQSVGVSSIDTVFYYTQRRINAYNTAVPSSFITAFVTLSLMTGFTKYEYAGENHTSPDAYLKNETSVKTIIV